MWITFPQISLGGSLRAPANLIWCVPAGTGGSCPTEDCQASRGLTYKKETYKKEARKDEVSKKAEVCKQEWRAHMAAISFQCRFCSKKLGHYKEKGLTNKDFPL
jgi:hypothetical protein